MAEQEPAAAPTSSPPTEQAGGILPPEHWAQQRLEFDDADSSLGEDVHSSTASLSSSILQYRTLQGRTFHSERVTDGQYWSPNDAKHTESMDIIHHFLLLALDGKLYRTPLKKDIARALDIGTGTGLWAIDFADEFPDCEVIGTDISPIQPSWVPPNVRFEIEDATKTWTYPDNSFDYVHMRYLFGSIADWDELYREAYRVCKPGGWIESFDTSAKFGSDDDSIPEGSPMDQWYKVFKEGGKKFSRTFMVTEEDLQRKGIEAAGFINQEVWDYKIPVNGWSENPKDKELGMYAQLAVEQDIEGYILYMWSQVMGWSAKEIQVFVAHFRSQLRDRSCHAYFSVRCVHAQKPLDAA
ncbi:S-adenosyl-L-methionine-dependent methyltransferase [Lasiosphaeris hirsuta]|uniref:S-adenosyl-L-methionine-dependent methyltransferase n=1 Tax=Lasiosphaeris hirsuta TaxID=260670 RepID=A0AA40E599_9PEZI|nr:S-adenosyl-L-methionine-dependent methyltransferase [Lasiosphaeris hirsuta]